MKRETPVDLPIAATPKFRLLWSASLLMAAVLVLDVIAILFFSQYFNYGAEGIELASLMRLSDGLPYITRIPEIPWYVNQYSPYFYVIAVLPIRLLGVKSLAASALCARTSVLLTASALLCCVYRHFEVCFSKRSFVFVSLWFLLLFPANIISVRPDFLAFLAEFIAFVAWRMSNGASGSGIRGVSIAGLIFGCALALKLNTVGVLAGLLIYEAWGRRWMRVSVLVATAAASTLMFLVLAWKIWGVDALRDTFLAIQNQRETASELTSRFVVLAAYAIPFGLLLTLGFRRLRQGRVVETESLLFAIAGSIVVATLQQAKAGSWYNYYYGAIALALVPASVGLDELFSDLRYARLSYATLGLALLHAVWATRVPVVIARDRFLSHYPFAQAASWLQSEVPRGAIYSDDPNALLHFRARVLLGPNSEIILNLTPALQPFIPQLRRNMRSMPYAAAIATGPSCAQWRPHGEFREETSHLTQLNAHFGWICVFVPPHAAER